MPAIEDIFNFAKRLKIRKSNNKKEIQKFDNKIDISKVKFNYKNKDGNQLIFENLNLKIRKGEKISIMGNSGSGKSTLIDILLGFLAPEKGKITIDGSNIKNYFFKNIISYCPQYIYIFDKSIEKNISLEDQYEKINLNKIEKLKKICCLNSFSKPKKNKRMLGEGGLKVSGGQKQRIGIARALYFNEKY